MGVQVNKKEVPATAETKIPLELTVISRYVVHGVLYERGHTYEFTPEQADTMLRLQDDRGLPVFRRWKPKATVKRDSSQAVRVDMTSGTPRVQATRNDGTKLMVDFTDEELEAAGIAIPDNDNSGDMSLGDLKGVKV
jgi:hypothetical protein